MKQTLEHWLYNIAVHVLQWKPSNKTTLRTRWS